MKEINIRVNGIDNKNIWLVMNLQVELIFFFFALDLGFMLGFYHFLFLSIFVLQLVSFDIITL